MKKTLIALLILLAAALVFTGCGGNDSSNPTGGSGSSELDGTWVCKWDIPPMTEENVTIPAFTMDAVKLVVSGNTYKIYMADFDALFVALEDWMLGGFATPNPPTTWDSEEMDEGTYTLSGNTVTTISKDDETLTNTLTLSSDKKQMTSANQAYDAEDPDPFDGPEYLVFKKQ